MTGLLSGNGYWVIDAAAAVILFAFSLAGARKGAICSVIGLCSTLLSLVAAYSLAVPIANLFDYWFAAYSKGGVFLWTAISAVIAFFAAKLLLSLLARFLTGIVNRIRVLGATNTLLGAVIGLLKAVILIFGVLAIISVLPADSSVAITANGAIDATFFTRVLRDHNPLLSWLKNVVASATSALPIG